MKYASSTLLFVEYMDQKDNSDQNDLLIKTTLEFLITNEFIALVHVNKEEIADVLTKGIICIMYVAMYIMWDHTLCVCIAAWMHVSV